MQRAGRIADDLLSHPFISTYLRHKSLRSLAHESHVLPFQGLYPCAHYQSPFLLEITIFNNFERNDLCVSAHEHLRLTTTSTFPLGRRPREDFKLNSAFCPGSNSKA